MRTWRIAAAALATLSATALPGVLPGALAGAASAQETLVDLVRAGQREAVLAAITSPDIDLDAAAPDGSTALHWATYAVDDELVRALLDAGASADVTSRYGASPLAEAVKLGDLELVRMLLEAGADADSPNQDNQTALMLAATLGALPVAELLLERGADVNAVETFRGQTAFMWAAAENHPDIVELLLAHGADVSVRARHDDWGRQMTSEPRAQFRPTGGLTALLYATRSSCHRCAVAIVEAGADVNQPNPDGVTPLINALDTKSFDIAMYLMDHGADIHAWDQYGRTPLYVAVDMNSFNPPVRLGGPSGFAGYGDPAVARRETEFTAMEVVNRLLDAGVDVNHELTRMRPNGPARIRFADYMMRGGTGPLMIATLSYDNEAIAALLAHGAEVDLPNVFQITPLMAAAGMSGTGRGGGPGGAQGDPQSRAIATIDLLLEGGADINAQVTDSRTRTAKLDTYVQGRDHEGQTALFGAAGNGWARVVEHLLARGADPSVRDAEGRSVLDVARAPVPGLGGAPPGGPGADVPATIALLEAILEPPASNLDPAAASTGGR
jgi:ankyrin repeat protein